MWVVCQNKDDGKLFISSRKARETMISVLLDLGQVIPSNVLTRFGSYSEAEKYKKEFEDSNKIITKTLNPNKQ